MVAVRADSAYYQRPVVAAARAAGARFSITARSNPQITKAITAIGDDAWTAITYPHAVFDELARGWVSHAAVAEVPAFTAFTSRPKAQQVSAQLIVRRVKRLNPRTSAGQDALFDTYRYHAVFTDSTQTMLDAEAHHRDHDRVQPHPRRRDPRRGRPRQSHDRDHPPAPDPHRGPRGHHRPPPAPTGDLSRPSVHHPVRSDLRTTTTRLDLTNPPATAPGTTRKWKRRAHR